MPAKADPKVRRIFLETTLEPLISLAQKGKIQLFFVDASHFVQGGFVGQLWTKVRFFVKTAGGRKRYNVLGALNFATKKLVTITNETYITGTAPRGADSKNAPTIQTGKHRKKLRGQIDCSFSFGKESQSDKPQGFRDGIPVLLIGDLHYKFHLYCPFLWGKCHIRTNYNAYR